MKNEQKKAQDPVQEDPRMPLTRRNYTLLAIGFAVILLGVILMAGGGNVLVAAYHAGPDPRDRRFRHRDLRDHETLQVNSRPVPECPQARRPRQQPVQPGPPKFHTLTE